MKTPMQKLIDHMNEKGLKNYPLDTLSLIKELKEKEKELIIESYSKGIEFGNEQGTAFEDLYSEKYFNETFKNQ